MGRTTTSVYDDAGRLWKTEFDDGTYTETRYTLQGWVKYQWDEKRNLTEYEYDLSGKRSAVIRYLDGRAIRHSYTYYDNGDLHTETDANLHTQPTSSMNWISASKPSSTMAPAPSSAMMRWVPAPK
ncbi:MAG: hypothetical protein MI976_28120 [Pseudomonadales bacterium]|nr:hypothetical protein [Pseudomonadales bacterium]